MEHSQDLQSFWRNDKILFWSVVAAICLSLYSGWTTWMGFANFTGANREEINTFLRPFYYFGTLIPTVGVQAFLLIGALLYGRQLKYAETRLDKVKGWFLPTLFAMFCSVFFSYHSVLGSLAGQAGKDLDRDGEGQAMLVSFLPAVRERAAEELARRKQGFVEAMNVVAKVAEENEAELNKKLELANVSAENARARLKTEAEDRATNRGQAMATKTAVAKSLAALQTKHSQDVQGLKTNISLLEGQLTFAQNATSSAEKKFIDRNATAKTARSVADDELRGIGECSLKKAYLSCLP